MYRSIFAAIFSLLLLASGAWAGEDTLLKKEPTPPDGAARMKIAEAYGNIPLYFIKNDGQVDGKVRYYERGNGHSTFFTRDGVYMTLSRSAEKEQKQGEPFQAKKPEYRSESIKLSFIDAKNPVVEAEGLQKGKVNYFADSDRSKWRTDIPTYSAIAYKEAYKGIDVKFYGNNGQLEYDVIVKPGSDPGMVRFAYEGIRGLRITNGGELEIILAQGSIQQKKPYIYQEISGKKLKVEGRFVLYPAMFEENKGEGRFAYGFEVASYDKDRELIIDPYIAYSTYLGGSSGEFGRGIAADNAGNTYLTGQTFSANFPSALGIQNSRHGANDGFITKLDSSGTIVYSTYLGGNSFDVGLGIAVDNAGNAYVTGYTDSPDFPIASAIQNTKAGGYDAFVAKIDAAGGLVYSTYLGGSLNDFSRGVAVDSSGNAYVTGYTASVDFPVVSAVQAANAGGTDAFITKFNPSGGLAYSTYLGGSLSETSYGIAINNIGEAYITGSTASADFPVVSASQQAKAGSYDAFVAKLNQSGNDLMYSTYLGGAGTDTGMGIAVYGISGESGWDAYVTGHTTSTDFPGPFAPGGWSFNRGGYDAFVAKLDATSGRVWTTYMGGTGDDAGTGISVSFGYPYITGYTSSAGFPVTTVDGGGGSQLFAGVQTTYGGGAYDAFVSGFNPSGTILYSTFLGGSDGDYGFGIVTKQDMARSLLVVGETFSTNFPTASAAQQASGGDYDAFLVRMTTANTPTVLSLSADPGYGMVAVNPSSGGTSTPFTFKIVYTDPDNNPPYFYGAPRLRLDNVDYLMSLDTGSSSALRDGNYRNGEQYYYITTLSQGTHTYSFYAVDGFTGGQGNWPSSGEQTIQVGDLAILTTTLPNGTTGLAYSQTLTATGGTAPYTWSVPAGGLPAGLTLSSAGVISGTPTSASTYGFTVSVTDATSFTASRSFSITISLGDTTPPIVSPSTPGGAYVAQQTVSLSSNEASTIYYTTNGTTPTLSSAVYLTPILVSGPMTLKYFAVDGSGNASEIVTQIYAITGGNVWTWGSNVTGELGDGTTLARNIPGQIPGLSDVSSIAGMWNNSIVLKTNGTVWAWGWNYYGQLGDGTTISRSTPVQVNGLADVAAVANGISHSLALKHDGTVWSWGNNWSGQLGDGTGVDRLTPVQVSGLASVVSIVGGGTHSLALRGDGTVWAWGSNTHGELGDGTIVARPAPVQVSGISNVIALAAAAGHSMALKNDGTVWAWGWNEYGQLGDGTIVDRTIPVQVTGLADVVAIAAGGEHSLAVKGDGTVWSWGLNGSGQLGDGTTVHKTTPVQVTGLTNVIEVSAGYSHSIALKNDGSLWAWGGNGSGALGDGTNIYRYTPVQVVGFTDVMAIASGASHNIAITGPDIAAPTGSISINNGAASSVSSDVTLSISATDNMDMVPEMRFSNDNASWSAWEAYATAKAWTLAAGLGAKIVYAQFRDASGNLSLIVYDSIVVTGEVDLVVSAFNAPANGTTGTSLTVTNTVRNNGIGTSASSYVKFYLSADAVIDATDKYLGQRYVRSLASGTTSSSSNSFKIPAAVMPGNYYIGAIADANGTNPESNEANNTASQAITIASGIDLAFSAYSAPGSGTTGSAVTVANTVKNNGIGTSATSYVKFYLSTDAGIDATDTYIGQRSVGSLAGSATSAATTSVKIPATVIPGSYYIGAIADANVTNPESDEANNTASQAITIASGIDLAFSSFSAPANGSTGSALAITNTVKNNGTGSSATSTVKFYLSADAVIDATDRYLGQRSVSSLAGGATSAATTSVRIPATVSPGSYYIGAISDANGTNPESDEANNTTSQAITIASGIDLAFSAYSAPGSGTTGTSVNVANTVRNNGTGTSASSYVKFYLSTDAVIDSTDVYLGQRSVGTLSGGATSAATKSVKIPATVSPGSYYIGAIADANGTNPESDEANNTTSQAITIASGIDLAFSALTVPASAESGTLMTVAIMVTNSGLGTSVSSTAKLYLSTDAEITSADTYLAQASISALNGGATSSGTITFKMPPSVVPGAYYLGVIADANGTNPESDEANNTASQAMTISSGIDLSFSAFSAPASGMTGSAVTVANTVRNNGTGTSASSYVKFYLSTDAVIDGTDIYLGQRSVSTLAGGSTSSASNSMKIPATVIPGNYYIGAIADVNGTNPESDEANNTASQAITLTSGIDLAFSAFSAPANGSTGDLITVANIVMNNGTGISATSYVKFYLSTDAAISAADIYLGQRSVGSLAGGSASSASNSMKIPATVVPGSYYIGAIADANGTNPESNEGNNTASQAITITSGIDLVITSFNAPSSWTVGSSLPILNTVKNQGSGTSVTSYVKFYLSLDPVIDASDRYLGQRSVSSLAGGASNSQTTYVTVPGSVLPGSYYIGAIADANGIIPESDETNNTASQLFDVTMP